MRNVDRFSFAKLLRALIMLTYASASALRGGPAGEAPMQEVKPSRKAFNVFALAQFGRTEMDVDNESAWEKVKSLQCFFLQKDIDTCISSTDSENDPILCSWCELEEEQYNNEATHYVCVPSFAAQALLDKHQATFCEPSKFPTPQVAPQVDTSAPVEPSLPPQLNTTTDKSTSEARDHFRYSKSKILLINRPMIKLFEPLL